MTSGLWGIHVWQYNIKYEPLLSKKKDLVQAHKHFSLPASNSRWKRKKRKNVHIHEPIVLKTHIHRHALNFWWQALPLLRHSSQHKTTDLGKEIFTKCMEPINHFQTKNFLKSPKRWIRRYQVGTVWQMLQHFPPIPVQILFGHLGCIGASHFHGGWRQHGSAIPASFFERLLSVHPAPWVPSKSSLQQEWLCALDTDFFAKAWHTIFLLG